MYDLAIIKQQIEQVMSLEKIKSAKNITYSDRYSKNPIINNLIKNKLQAEMVGIKQSVANIIKKQSQNPGTKTASRIPIKRNKSYSINPKLIQEGTQYNPVDRINNLTQQFIAHRQTDSFLVPTQQLIKINKAREEYAGLTTKFTKSDAIKYETEGDLIQFSQKVHQGTAKQYSQDVWLPAKPEIKYMIEEKYQQIEDIYESSKLAHRKDSKDIFQKQLSQFGDRIAGKTITLGLGNKKYPDFPILSFKNSQANLKPTEYIPQKFHKNDYKLIQSWLQKTLQQLSKQANYKPYQKLNITYSSYVCVWKQLIRLTYIQSQQKGLIIQKMFYSLLRLFWGIIGEQHSQCKANRKQSDADHKQIKGLMQQRMQQLQKRHQANTKEIEDLKQINHKLSQVFISFEKINHEMVTQLEVVTKQKKQIQRQFYIIGNSFYKTLQILYDKNMIEMDINTEQSEIRHSRKKQKSIVSYKTFFLFDNASKPLMLGRFKNEENETTSTHRYSVQSIQETKSEELQKYNKRIGHALKQIQNQLVRYWDKKQDDLELKGIINQYIVKSKIKDACIGSNPIATEEFSAQFPQNNQQYIQKLLNDLATELKTKFQLQKNHFQSQIQKKQGLLHKWKASSEQMHEKNKSLQQTITRLNQNIKKSKQSSNELLMEIQSLIKTQQQSKKIIKNLNQVLEKAREQKEEAISQKAAMEKQNKAYCLQTEKEKQNNKMLVRSNLEMREKVEKFEIKYNNIFKSIKSVAPWLQKFLGQVDKSQQEINMKILKDVGEKIQQYLSEYVVKDSNLFMTRLT